MLAGIPIAASRVPELRRFVEGHALGLTFNPDDPRDIASTLNFLLADRSAMEMREHSREAARRFVWENEVPSLSKRTGPWISIMPRRFLFLHGGPEEARRVFREERRGYWAAALPVVLEKHGLTSFEELTVAGLEEALRRDEVGAVLVARTAARAETTGVLHRLRRLGIPLLIEGPLPCELHELAGIVSAEPTAAEGAVNHEPAARFRRPPSTAIRQARESPCRRCDRSNASPGPILGGISTCPSGPIRRKRGAAPAGTPSAGASMRTPKSWRPGQELTGSHLPPSCAKEASVPPLLACFRSSARRTRRSPGTTANIEPALASPGSRRCCSASSTPPSRR